MITSQNTIDTLNQHVSIRHYTEAGIDDDTLMALLNAARRSPTSSNTQTYSFVVVRDPATKKTLAELAGNQRHIETCPVFVACCADTSRLQRACELHGQTLARNTESALVAVVDASIAGMSLATAAESIGLGTVMIGGMRNHPEAVAELLGLPEGAFVVYGLCMGWPADRPPQKPRLPQETVIHFERYSHEDPTAALAAYDRDLAQHYRDEGRSTPDAAWTGVIASKFSHFNRPELKAILAKLGLRFD